MGSSVLHAPLLTVAAGPVPLHQTGCVTVGRPGCQDHPHYCILCPCCAVAGPNGDAESSHGVAGGAGASADHDADAASDGERLGPCDPLRMPCCSFGPGDRAVFGDPR